MDSTSRPKDNARRPLSVTVRQRVRHSGLGRCAKHLLLALLDHVNEKEHWDDATGTGICFPGQHLLALETGYTDTQLRKEGVPELEQRRLIVVERQGVRRPNRYRVSIDAILSLPDRTAPRSEATSDQEAAQPEPKPLRDEVSSDAIRSQFGSCSEATSVPDPKPLRPCSEATSGERTNERRQREPVKVNGRKFEHAGDADEPSKMSEPSLAKPSDSEADLVTEKQSSPVRPKPLRIKAFRIGCVIDTCTGYALDDDKHALCGERDLQHEVYRAERRRIEQKERIAKARKADAGRISLCTTPSYVRNPLAE